MWRLLCHMVSIWSGETSISKNSRKICSSAVSRVLTWQTWWCMRLTRVIWWDHNRPPRWARTVKKVIKVATRDKNRHLRSIIASSPKAFITSTRFSRSKTELQKRHRNSQNRVRPSTWNQEPSIQKIWRRCTRPMTTCSLVTNSGNHKRKRIKSARTLPVEVVAREVVKAVCAGAKESKLKGV